MPRNNSSETLKLMERKLLRLIINPAMIATYGFGAWMLALDPALLHQPFMHVKLGLVLALTAVHAFLARCRRAFAEDLLSIVFLASSIDMISNPVLQS